MKPPPAKFVRDTVLFVIGLLGVAHETLLAHAERPTLLLLFAAMIGLPAFIGNPKDDDPPKKSTRHKKPAPVDENDDDDE